MPQHPEIGQLFQRGGEGLQKAYERSEIQPDKGPVVLNGFGLGEKYLICFLHSRHRMEVPEMEFNYWQALLLAHEKRCESVEIQIPSFPNALSVIQKICAAFLERYDTPAIKMTPAAVITTSPRPGIYHVPATSAPNPGERSCGVVDSSSVESNN